MYKIQIKSENGVTLATLTIYLIIFALLIGVMTTISTYFYSEIYEIIDTPKYISEFNKFVMFFAIDIKNYNEATVTDNMIEFEDGPIYSYTGSSIYRNDVLVAYNILECTFTPKTYNVNDITKNLINVNMKIGRDNERSVTKNIDFTLKYW